MVWVVPLVLAAAPLAFEEALARADAVPELAGAQQGLAARREGLEALSPLTTNPTVTLQPGLRAEGRGPLPEAQLTLTQGVNVSGFASARKAAAGAELDAARAAITLSRVERRAAVARAWLATWAAQRLHEATHDEVTQAKDLVARLERVVAGGGTTLVELASARAFAAEAAAFHLSWEGHAIEAGARLALLLSLPDIATVAPEVPALGPLDLALARADNTPEVQLRTREAEAAARRVEEARTHTATQLQLSLQGGHEAPTQWFGNLGIGVTLPLFERNQREVARARAEAAQLEGARLHAGAAARVRLQLLVHELEHAAEVYEVVHGTQQPAAAEAARLETRRFEQGEATLLEVLPVRRQALQALVASVEAEADLLAVRAQARELLATLGSRP